MIMENMINVCFCLAFASDVCFRKADAVGNFLTFGEFIIKYIF